jgi:uncharacterized integral membrane protein
MTVPTQAETAPSPAPADPSAVETHGAARTGRTRLSSAWIGIVAAALVLVLLLIFILQNTRSVKVTYFTASGTIPVGVALLFAAIGGLLLAGLMASLRIWQLHHRLSQAATATPDAVALATDDSGGEPA